MKKYAITMLLFWFAIVFTADLHTYGDIYTPNAGVYWDLGHHWCGLEYKGHPGFFCDVS